jgi:hypothetical protein
MKYASTGTNSGAGIVVHPVGEMTIISGYQALWCINSSPGQPLKLNQHKTCSARRNDRKKSGISGRWMEDIIHGRENVVIRFDPQPLTGFI